MPGGAQNPKVTERESNEMFAYWCDGPNGRKRSMSEVARHFNRARNTIYAAKKQFQWDERYQKIVTKSEAAVDKDLIKKVATTKEILKGAFIKCAKAVLNTNFEPKIQDTATFCDLIGKLTVLGRVMLEIDGDLPGENAGKGDNHTHLHLNYGELSEAERESRVKEWVNAWNPGGNGSHSRF